MGGLIELGHHDTNLLNYHSWTIGTNGSQGGFGINGSSTENYIIEAADPWGKLVPVWEARPDSTSGPDGGWNHSSFSIDNSKFYRFSTWVRRPVQGNGHFYMGLNGYGSTSGVLHRSSGNNNTNPYFEVNGSWTEWGNNEEWYLAVAHVWPAGSGTGSFHEESGIYTIDGKFHPIEHDFVWRNETTSARHRTYLYYSTNTATRQQWVYPRMEICDGNEPTINDLISGHDSRTYEYNAYLKSGGNHKPIEPSKNSFLVNGSISEVGPSKGLVGYWPLNGNAYDYSGEGNDGTVTGGGVYSSGVKGSSYNFRGPGNADYITVPYSQTTQHSVVFWAKLDVTISTTRRTLLKGNGHWNPGIWLDIDTIRGHASTEYRDITWTADLNWHQIGQVFNGTTLYMILDGELVLGTRTNYSPGNPTQIIIGNESIGGTSYTWPGKIDDVRIYNRALSAEEVKVLYDMYNPNAIEKVKLSKTTLYLSGEVKEK